MRTFHSGYSRRVHKWKGKSRRSFHRINNRRKLSRVYQSMNAAGRNLGRSVQSSDVISLIDDDDNIASESKVGRLQETCKNAQTVTQEGGVGCQHKSGWKCSSRCGNFTNTNIVDLSNDKEQPNLSFLTSRISKQKRKSGVLGGDDKLCVSKKLKMNPATIVGSAGNEVKILGLDSGVTAVEKNSANKVVVVPEVKSDCTLPQNSCFQKTEEAEATCVEKMQDILDSTEVISDGNETFDSVVVLDSDDECPVAACSKNDPDYIPLVRKRLNTSVEILDHVSRVPQSPELMVVKHIHPSNQTSSKQTNEDAVMFEDRTGQFEQFYNADFWKKLKNRKEQRQCSKPKARDASTAEQQPEPVKQRDDSNIYNPSPVVEIGGLRPIIIDGNNVAWGHGNHKNFSAPGLEICINYFSQRKHRVIAFVPQYRKTKKVPGLIEMLEKYERLGQIVITPSRKIDGKTVSSYDDRYIVQAATELGGVIVSTDNYRDLMVENQRWKETIEKRLLMFTWVGDMLMFPQDPLGRNGPTLEEFLRFPG